MMLYLHHLAYRLANTIWQIHIHIIVVNTKETYLGDNWMYCIEYIQSMQQWI